MTRIRYDAVPVNGVILIDKPTGLTSHDVVDVLRRLYRTRRVGHAGTLDPAASGVLVILLGTATRAASLFSDCDKTYHAEVHLGARSDTGDAEGEIIATEDPIFPDENRLHLLLENFTGTISQKIPAYAATRTNGERRYTRARRGEDLPEELREVTIGELALLSYEPPTLAIRVRCSKGTYIRSLATEIGDAAGCGAYLSALRREQSGRCELSLAYTLADLTQSADRGEALPEPQSFEKFLQITVIDIKPESLAAVRCGRQLGFTDVVSVNGNASAGDTILLRETGTGIVAIATALSDSTTWESLPETELIFRYRRVLVSAD